MKWYTIMVIIAFLLTGCNNNSAMNENNNNNDQAELLRVKNSTIEQVDRKSGQQISKHLVDLATRIPNVNDATAVVLGKYAIVGIDVKENIDRSEVGSIKFSVAESLKKDPYGARAVVVADPDMTARIQEISDDIENGHPVQGILNELADISGRMMPEIPADILEPKQPKKKLDEPKNKLDEQGDKKLEKQQEKQSNFYKDGKSE